MKNWSGFVFEYIRYPFSSWLYHRMLSGVNSKHFTTGLYRKSVGTKWFSPEIVFISRLRNRRWIVMRQFVYAVYGCGCDRGNVWVTQQSWTVRQHHHKVNDVKRLCHWCSPFDAFCRSVVEPSLATKHFVRLLNVASICLPFNLQCITT